VINAILQSFSKGNINGIEPAITFAGKFFTAKVGR